MADYNLGTARGVIEIEYKGDGARQAQQDLGRTKASADQVHPALQKSGRAAGIAGAVIAAGFGVAAKTAADFEAQMSAVAAVSGASEGQLEALRSKALQLGKDTQFSASESAAAMEELVKAGLSVDDVLNGAADATVALAAAGGVNMPEAAAIASNAMNQFNLTAKDMNGVVNDIAGAANASAIDVSDFGMSLSQVGAVANLAGVNFKDTATAIALMGNAGIKGSDAGTSLKTMFQRLQPTTDAQRATMEKLGLITFNNQNAMKALRDNGVKPLSNDSGVLQDQLMKLAAEMSGSEVGSAKARKAYQELTSETGAMRNQFYDAEGNVKSLSEVSELLQNSLSGMSAEQKQAALNTLFGSDAIRGAAVLANNGAEGFDKMAGAMGKVSAADVAAKRMDNFKGSLEEFKGSLETLGIIVGSMLLPALRGIVDGLTAALGAFISLPGPIQGLIVALVGVIGVALLVFAAIVKFIQIQKAVQVALAGTRVAFLSTWLAALGPIALVIAAVVAVAAILVILWKKSETFRNIVLGVWDAIKSAASAVAGWFAGPFVNFFVSAWNAIKAGLSAVKGFFSAIWGGIKAVVSAVFSGIAAVITTYINIWKAVIGAGLAVVRAVWGAVWGTFGGTIRAVFGLIVAIIRLFVAIIRLVIFKAWQGIKAVTSAVWNAIVGVVRAVWARISATVRFYVNLVRAVVNAVWNGIKAVTSKVWNGIMGVIRAVWGKIGGTVTNAVNKVRSGITNAWNAVRSATVNLWNKVVSTVGDKISDIIDKIRDIGSKVRSAVSGAGRWLYDAGRAIIRGLLDGINSMISSVTNRLNDLTKKIRDAKGPEEVDRVLLKDNGRIIMQSLIDGFVTMEPQVIGGLEDLTRRIPQAVQADLSSLARATDFAPPVLAGGGAAAPTAPLSLAGVRLSGELTLRNGRAYISGVALETMENQDSLEAVRERMGAA